MSLFRRFKQKSTKFRIALGLCSITVTLMLIGSFLGLVPNQQVMKLEQRAAMAEVVAANSTLLITHKDVRRMQSLLQNIIDRHEDIHYATIHYEDGTTIANAGNKNLTGLEKISVPVWEQDQKWGEVSLHFEPLYPEGIIGFFHHPTVHYILFVSVISFIFFFFYLGRMLKLLDPSQAIPDRVRSALDTMAEGLLVLDAKQNIVLANQAFAHIVQKSSAELVGLNCKEFEWVNVDGSKFVPKDSPWGRAINQSKAVTSKRVRLNLPNSHYHTFMVNCSPVLANSGKAGGVLVSFDDVTVLEQKEIELLKSKEEAEIANQSKSDFLANMSHEIRTPMNAIMGFTEVLRRGYSNGQNSVQYLDTIAKNSRHLLELINDILDLSKVESGQIEVERIPSALHEIIYDVLEVLEVSATNKNITLDYKPLTDLPETIETDPARTRQIVTNLIGNAIKFTQTGGITVTTEMVKKGKRPHIKIAVQDTGIGMTDTQIEHIFSPFVQADSSITRRFGGTGLGLTISKKFAEALGGDIKVTSSLGRGSCFTLFLPLGEVANVKMLDANAIQSRHANSHQQNVIWKFPEANVLAVDDSEENRELIKLVLEHQGLKVSLANNGKDAIEMVAKQKFALVLMDVQMPVMDGYTAVAKIRESKNDVPIFALTAHAMKGIEQKCLNAGFNGYIAKPIEINRLLSSVAECIGGEFTESDESQIPVLTDIQAATAASTGEKGDKAAVVSILQNNPKYRGIISKFVAKLEEQLQEIKQKTAEQDFDEVTELAHKLKGSAGTVGFYSFTDPFHKMENASKEGNVAMVKVYIAEVESMCARIDKSQLDMGDKPALKQKNS